MNGDWTILPAPAGFEYIEIHDDSVYRSAVLAMAYNAERGLVPLGLGDTADAMKSVVAIVLPDGQVESTGDRWPTVEAFLASKGIGGQADGN